jgi:hypothetical protein
MIDPYIYYDSQYGELTPQDLVSSNEGHILREICTAQALGEWRGSWS